MTQPIFIELEKEWFDTQSENDGYTFEDEAYSQYLDTVTIDLDMYLNRYNSMTAVSAKLHYPDGTQSLIPDVSKLKDDDVLVYDFEQSVWKHRYVIAIKPRTDEGKKRVEDVLKKIKRHPAFSQINKSLVLVGEVSRDEQCPTC